MADDELLELALDEGLGADADGDAVNLQIEGDEELLPSEENQPVSTTSELPDAVTSTTEQTQPVENDKESLTEDHQSSQEDDNIPEFPSRTGVR